ncbi:MAG: phosphotransferase, partial [Candidatus Nezhaarchaeales archaeon]
IECHEGLKEFGYGVPYLVKYEVNGERKGVVLETMKPDHFGHEEFSDRAQALLWAHSAFNKLPKHVRSVDVGAFTVSGTLKSLGDCKELFILVEKVEGEEYWKDLERIKREKVVKEVDVERCRALANYIAEIHSIKMNAPELYIRRIRELIGHGECIMGLIDNYPLNLDFTSEEELMRIELKSVKWRWKLKGKTHRLSVVHGDFHPWNVLFKGNDFTLLDRSRGEYGEPADDVAAMTINYLFFSLQASGRLEGAFETLYYKFLNSYLTRTRDEELFSVIQPFYAWRGLVIASPMWYPKLPYDVRRKIFNFILNVLDEECFDPKRVNSYIKY